jgi:hypothetical protein
MAVLIATEEVCEILGIKPNYLHQLEYRKQIKWVGKHGKRVFYDRDAIEELKAKRDLKRK